jgi:two-component system, chemotaxis family, sensor kinase CheA
MDDLIGEFITETSESLAVLDLELVKLEQNPNDQGILGNIFRLVHTIKGTCGFLGLPRLESVAHAGENVLGKIRDGAIIVSPEAISIVLAAIDRIKMLIEHLADHGSEPDGEDKELIVNLNRFAESNGAPGTSTGGAAAVAAPVAPPVDLNAPPRIDGMFSPTEMKMVSSTSQSEMEELERAFANATSTLDGGMDFTRDTFLLPDAPAAPAEAALPVPAKPIISEQVKEKAIKQGLDTDAKDSGAGMANQSIRVSLDVLENLMQMVGELVLTRNQLLQVVRHRDDGELKAPLQQLSQITSELQESVMKTRMQPIGNAWSKFPRLIRDLSLELSKKIDLKMIGESTELDRQLLEMIKDPLTHMVRNSCDHGLEIPADRIAAGKSETGSVTLSAFHEGGHIIIEIKDDGRGLNLTRIKQKILDNGLADESELSQMSDEQIMQHVFKAGFSTAEKVTSVSGRGVGMDVVRTNIEKIGGTVSLSSTPGKGSTFHIKIPLTLAIVSVLLVEAQGQKFAVPQLNVVELVRVGQGSEYKVESINNTAVLRLRDKLLPLMKLRDILKMPQPVDDAAAPQERDGYIVVLRIGATSFGLVIDKVHDTEEIVVKPVSPVLGGIEVYSGNTILGDGGVIMILDPNGLAKSFGDRDTNTKDDIDPLALLNKEKIGSFLVFAAGAGAPKAVPLELVSRLEVIDTKDVELSGHEHVVQYRGDLMRLKTLPDMSVPTDGEFDVVVFTYDSRTIGLVVDSITDIVEAPLSIKISASEEHYLGSIVITGKTTDIVDVGYLLKDLVSDLGHLGNESADARGVRVLVVEDSLFFLKLIVPLLESVGYEVAQATGAQQALDLVATHQGAFDVIITDIEMPEMDGFELSKRLRMDKRLARTPIIAFTSTVNDTFKKRAVQAGIDGVILKTDREALLIDHHPRPFHLQRWRTRAAGICHIPFGRAAFRYIRVGRARCHALSARSGNSPRAGCDRRLAQRAWAHCHGLRYAAAAGPCRIFPFGKIHDGGDRFSARAICVDGGFGGRCDVAFDAKIREKPREYGPQLAYACGGGV